MLGDQRGAMWCTPCSRGPEECEALYVLDIEKITAVINEDVLEEYDVAPDSDDDHAEVQVAPDSDAY